MSDILAPEAVSRIDGFYDTTLKPKLDAIDHQRRQIRWLIVKSLLIVLPPIGILVAGDLLDGIVPFISSTARIVITSVWLVGGVVFVLLKHRLPGVTAYANLTVDNPVFEKEFKVHASNESEARALLTPAVAEGLLTLRRQAGKRVFLAFKGQRAFLGVDYERKLFEPADPAARAAALAYLNLIEKMNCGYCGYANGVLAYVREIAGRTERSWCPIRHAKRVRAPHPHYRQLVDYGDAAGYQQQQLPLLRAQLKDEKTAARR